MAFLNELLIGFVELFSAPFKDITVFWLIIPLFVMWLILEVYFGKHKSEKLGWNTALGNGMTLTWISLDMIKNLFFVAPTDKWLKFGVMMGFLVYGVIVIFTAFKHKVSEKIAFMVAAPTPIYYFAGIAVLWAFGTLQLTLVIIIDIFILFTLVLIFTWILKKMMKSDVGSDFGGSGDSGLLGSTPGLGGTEKTMGHSDLDKGLEDFKF